MHSCGIPALLYSWTVSLLFRIGTTVDYASVSYYKFVESHRCVAHDHFTWHTTGSCLCNNIILKNAQFIKYIIMFD